MAVPTATVILCRAVAPVVARNPLQERVLLRKQRTSSCTCHVGGRGFEPRRTPDSLAVGK